MWRKAAFVVLVLCAILIISLSAVVLVSALDCVYEAPGVCLAEEDLVKTLYAFNNQELNSAIALAGEIAERIEDQETTFSVTYKDMTLHINSVEDDGRFGEFDGNPEPETIGTIRTDGSFESSYHEVIHALQYIKLKELLQRRLVSEKRASRLALEIKQWTYSQESGYLKWSIEWLPTWEECRYGTANDLALTVICHGWEPFEQDPDIYDQNVPTWGSDLMLSWAKHINPYYEIEYGEPAAGQAEDY